MNVILLYLFIVGIIWAITAIVYAVRESARKRDIERIKADNAKRAEAQKQMQVEMKLAETRRKAIEAEQQKQAKEQQKQAKEQEKQAKEQEKQAKTILKHETEIMKLKQKMEKSERDMEYWNERIANLYAMLDTVLMRQDGMVVGSTAHTKCQSEIMALESKIHTAEENYYKAKNAKEIALQKIG